MGLPYYDVSGIGEVTNLADSILHVNSLSGGLFFPMLLVSLSVVMFMGMKSRGHRTDDILLSVSTIISLIGGLAWKVSSGALIGYNLLIGPVVIMVGLILYRINRGD